MSLGRRKKITCGGAATESSKCPECLRRLDISGKINLITLFSDPALIYINLPRGSLNVTSSKRVGALRNLKFALHSQLLCHYISEQLAN
jgi:hypothetical protein